MNNDELLGKIQRLTEDIWKTKEVLFEAEHQLAVLNLEYRRRCLNFNIKQETIDLNSPKSIQNTELNTEL